MENNNNNNKNKSFMKKLFSSNGSVIASFAIAIIGIVSLVAFGFSQISFALPDVENPLPDSFTTNDPKGTEQITGSTGGFVVYQYFTTVNGKKIPVYCLEKDTFFCQNTKYTKDSTMINDAGLLYLMANLYPHVKLKYNNVEGNEKTQTWLSQTAIWIYLKKSGYDNQSEMTDAKINSITNETALHDAQRNPLTNVNGKLYEVYKSNELTINALIDKALTLKGQAATSLTVSKNSDTISVTSDEKYYQTDLISVAGSVSDEAIGQFNGYKLTIRNAPDGTLIVDENGEEIKDLTNMVPGTKFYVRIPVDKVTEETKNVSISVEGSFKSFTGNRYVADGCQTITAVKTVNNNISQPLDIEINYTPDVPDTGMSTAQSIYFIGLIVLLCGIGIIYANVKPRKSN